jgi:hypothetical protein
MERRGFMYRKGISKIIQKKSWKEFYRQDPIPEIPTFSGTILYSKPITGIKIPSKKKGKLAMSFWDGKSWKTL